VSRYIHLNPVRGKSPLVSHPREWRWSSYPGCGSRRARFDWVAYDFVGEKPYLDGNRFTAGDLIMTTVLRPVDHTEVVAPDKRHAAYVERCASRPAFKRALDAHLQDFQSPT
jgi:glutathione S-transferase